MTTVIEHLRALVGGKSFAEDLPLLTAADARAAQLPREHGVLYSEAVQEAIVELAPPGPCQPGEVRAVYYLGLQIGWRAAHRLR